MIIITSNRHLVGLREAIAALPVEQTINLNVSKIYQQLIECFYAYESHLAHFVFDRDMHNIIYSLGFVPVSSKGIENLFYLFCFAL
jgi:hypothetical protein